MGAHEQFPTLSSPRRTPKRTTCQRSRCQVLQFPQLSRLRDDNYIGIRNLLYKTQSPEPRAQSPEPRAQSPEPRAQSPEPRAQSPDPRAQSPEPRAHSPFRSVPFRSVRGMRYLIIGGSTFISVCLCFISIYFIVHCCVGIRDPIRLLGRTELTYLLKPIAPCRSGLRRN